MSSAEKATTALSSELRRAWAEGVASGPSLPFEIEETKRLARRKLAAIRDVKDTAVDETVPLQIEERRT